MKLPHRTLIQALELVREIHASAELERLRSVIPETLARLIPADRVSLDEVDLDDDHRVVIPNPMPAYWGKLGSVFCSHVMEHPIWNRVGRSRRAVLFSDYRHDRRWRRSTLYHEYHVPIGARQQLAGFIHGENRRHTGVAFSRSARDFNETERSVFELLVPHLNLAWHNARRLLQLRQPALPATPGATRTEVITIDCVKGVMLDGTPEVSALLQGSLIQGRGAASQRLQPARRAGRASRADHLPDEIHRWLRAQCARFASVETLGRPPEAYWIHRRHDTISLHVLEAAATMATLLVRQHPPASATRATEREQTNRKAVRSDDSPTYALTTREAEILHWIAEGKRNAEIARILGISPRTIGKHVEHVLNKLGVETRTAAARYASTTCPGEI